MFVEENEDVATRLLIAVNHRLRDAHVSGGNASASVKELTTCRLAAWKKRWEDWPEKDWDEDPVAMIRVLLGTAWGDLVNPDPEERIEILTPAGVISGRIDYIDNLGETVDFGNGHIFTYSKLVPAELKLTWKSPRKQVSELGQYIEQLAGYCVAKQSLVGRLYVLHITSYEKNSPPVPKLRGITLTWTEKELNDWKMELGRRAAEVNDRDNMPSPNGTHYKDECEYCDFHISKLGDCPGGRGYTDCFFELRDMPDWAF